MKYTRIKSFFVANKLIDFLMENRDHWVEQDLFNQYLATECQEIVVGDMYYSARDVLEKFGDYETALKIWVEKNLRSYLEIERVFEVKEEDIKVFHINDKLYALTKQSNEYTLYELGE